MIHFSKKPSSINMFLLICCHFFSAVFIFAIHTFPCKLRLRKRSFVEFSERSNCILCIHLVIVAGFDVLTMPFHS